MPVVAFVVLIIVFARLRRRRRWWRHPGVVLWQGQPFGPWWLHVPERDVLSAQRQVPAPVKRETAFESLKKRYVAGQLSDEQYEREVDALLQTPEGRAQVQ